MLPWRAGRGGSLQGSQKSPYVLWSQRLQGSGGLHAFIYYSFVCRGLFARLLETNPSCKSCPCLPLHLPPSPGHRFPGGQGETPAPPAAGPASGPLLLPPASPTPSSISSLDKHHLPLWQPKRRRVLPLHCSDRLPGSSQHCKTPARGRAGCHSARCSLLPCLPSLRSPHLLPPRPLPSELSARGEAGMQISPGDGLGMVDKRLKAKR